MKRRELVTGAAAAALVACRPKEKVVDPGALPRIRWRLASSFPRGLDTIFGVGELFARRVEELSGGRFQIRIYPPGELVPGLQVFDGVQLGTAQVGHSVSYYYWGKNPALVFDAAVPFGLTARQRMSWIYEGGGLELLREVFAEFNIVNFPGGCTGTQMGGWYREPITGLDSLNGLKVRIPGLGGKVMSEMGAIIQVLPGGEIIPALERGAIDGAEWVGPYDDERFGFHKVAKHYHYPGWWEPGPSLAFYVNKEAYEALPPIYKAIVEVSARDADMALLNRYDAKNPPALQRIIAAGVSVTPFPDDVIREARKISASILDDMAQENASFAKLHASWKKFKVESSAWFRTAEQAYARIAYEDRE